MPTGGFEALFVDFYGTIAAGDRAAVEATCRSIVKKLELPLTAPELAVRWGEEFFQEMEGSNGDAFQTLRACEQVSLETILSRLGIQAEVDEFIERLQVYMAHPPIHPDAYRLLEMVDLPICCVSNADNGPLLSAIERCGLRFEAVITSEDARSYKPDSAIFEQALQRLGVPPERALHVGDSLHADVGGARRAGITPVWLCRENRIHDLHSCEPDHQVDSLSEVPRFLSQKG